METVYKCQKCGALDSGEIEEWKESALRLQKELDIWYEFARKADVPKWDGNKYSSTQEWTERILKKIN